MNSPERNLGGDESYRSVRDLIRRVRFVEADQESATPSNVPPHSLDETKPIADGPTLTQGVGSVSDEQIKPATDLDTSSHDHESATLPQVIGRFEIERVIGRGGFGVVVLARDPQLNRPVALKIPKFDALISSDCRKRFVREAKAAALLGHPNIVSVYEAAQAGPLLYIVFEWIDGQSLTDFIKSQSQPLESKTIARLIAALAAGIQHAHQRGIIHRDLKPANILISKALDRESITYQDIASRAKIADFGMVHWADADGVQTQSGAMMGTPMYMAPEQIDSQAGAIGPAVDVYGLGAILYELLTGQPPFTGPNLIAIVRAVEHQTPIVPHKLAPNVSRDLEAICLKCLEKDPTKRYPAAASLQDDLERFLAGRSIRARRWTRREQLTNWVRRNRLVSGLTLAIFVALLSGLGLALWQANRNRGLYQDVLVEKNRAEQHLERAESAIDTMLNDVVDVLEPIPHMAELRRKLLEQALRFEQQLIAVESNDIDVQIRAARAEGRIGNLLIRLGDLPKARASLERAMSALSSIPAETDEQASLLEHLEMTNLVLLARTWSEAGQYKEAAKILRPQIDLWNERDLGACTDQQLLDFAGMLNSIALTYTQIGNFPEAEKNYLLQLDLLNRFGDNPVEPKRRIDRAKALSSLTRLYLSMGQTEQAIEQATANVAFIEQALLNGNNDHELRYCLATSFSQLFNANNQARQYAEAEKNVEQAISLTSKLCADYPEIRQYQELRFACLLGQTIAAHRSMVDPEATEQYYINAISVGEELEARFGSSPNQLQNLTLLYGNYAVLLRKVLGKQEEAWPLHEKQLSAARRFVESYNQIVGRFEVLGVALGNAGSYCHSTGDLALAEALLREADTTEVTYLALVPGSPTSRKRLLEHRELLCTVLAEQHEYDHALDEAIRISQFDAQSSQIQVAAAGAVAAIIESGRRTQARQLDDQVLQRGEELLISLLTSAMDLGWRDEALIHHLAASSGLAESPRIQQFLDSLGDEDRPANNR